MNLEFARNGSNASTGTAWQNETFTGYRALLASILAMAVEDATKSTRGLEYQKPIIAPYQYSRTKEEKRAMIRERENRHNRNRQLQLIREARDFLYSPWCETLAAELDLDIDAIRERIAKAIAQQ